MKVAVHADPAAAARAAAETAARLLRDALAARGRAVFVAATGVSQMAFLAHLVAAPGIDWTRTTLFHLDEYIGFSPDHPASLRRYLRERLTSRVPVGTVHFIEADAPDLAGELARLNRILAATPVDVAFLGIGENGHLAFNDPPADFETEAPFILVDLDETYRRQQFRGGPFASLDDVPRRAVSMSIRQIMKAGSLVCTAPEGRKARAVKMTLEDEIAPRAPASILRRHARCFLFLDRDSAGELSPETLNAFADA
jgi:glucosamine-6-phosphate deaminase